MLVIGLDVGTTGTKALVIDESGRVLSSAYREYELKQDGPFVTQNANDWWDAVIYTIRTVADEVDRSKIAAISLSTQGASMLATDGDGNPLCDVITWMDSRSMAEVNYLSQTLGAETVYRKCGWPLLPAGDASKILWMRRHMPDVFKSAAMFPSTIEFINKKLTGRFVTDPTNAAIRQLFNIAKCEWDAEILKTVGITEDRLPEILSVAEPVGYLTGEAASELGLNTAVTVYCGAHDQYCAALGAGATEPGDMLLATGTAWVVLGVMKEPLFNSDRICPGIHPAKGCYGAMASLISAGSALKWYKNLIDGDFKTIDSEAERRRESAKDLFVLPYVAGAGFPHNRPDVGGTVSGFRLGTDRYDIARAVMEGVAFEARTVIEKFAESGIKIRRLMMTGGAARSELWSRIVGEVTGCEIVRPIEPETCCVGAAECALVGLGTFHDFKSCKAAMVKSRKIKKPSAEDIAFYDEKYGKYCAIRSKIFEI